MRAGQSLRAALRELRAAPTQRTSGRFSGQRAVFFGVLSCRPDKIYGQFEMTANRGRSGVKLLKRASRFADNILFAFLRSQLVVMRVSDSLLAGGVAYVQEARHFQRFHGPVRLGSGSFVRLSTERGVRSFERDAQSGHVRAVRAVPGKFPAFHGGECGGLGDFVAGIGRSNGNAVDAMVDWRANVQKKKKVYALANVYGDLTDEQARALRRACVRAYVRDSQPRTAEPRCRCQIVRRPPRLLHNERCDDRAAGTSCRGRMPEYSVGYSRGADTRRSLSASESGV